MSRVDVEAVRRDHPLAEVVTAAGIELSPRAKGFMAHCPFHVEDRTPSLSVDGVPGRFHCFGCGATGDVIDFVARLHGLDFRAAVDRLDAGHSAAGVTQPGPLRNPAPVLDRTSRARVIEINEMAWTYFTQPANRQAAERYLRHVRGLDLDRALAASPYPALVGLAPNSRDSLARRLQRHGVDAQELLGAGLAYQQNSHLVDAFRGRVIVPVRDSHDRIEGFLGRDITGSPRAPKYLNPTTTAAFDKARSLYWPLGRPQHPSQLVIIVEGFIDALAIASSCNPAGRQQFPCSASGVSVSPAQASEVAALTNRPVLLALDADTAGQTGAQRWRHHFDQLGRSSRIIHLPAGRDPADLVAQSPTHELTL